MSERNEANSMEPCVAGVNAEHEPVPPAHARADASGEVECESAPRETAAAEPLAAAPAEAPVAPDAEEPPERSSGIEVPPPERRISQEESDAEWLDLSTRWLVAPPVPPGARKSRPRPEFSEPADWASSLAAQVGPPASSRRSTLPPQAPRLGPSDPWAQALPPGAARGYRTGAFQTLPPGWHGAPPPGWAGQPAARQTWHGAAAISGGPAEPDPWREEPSFTDGRMARAQADAWAAAVGRGLPPWAAELPGYAGGAWPDAAAAYAAAGWQPQPQAPQTLPPWARASGQFFPQYPGAPQPPGARAARPPTQGSAPLPARRDWLQPVRRFGDGWLSAFAKLAIAAGALHYSGLTEPLLAHWRPGGMPAQPPAAAPLAASAGLPPAALVEPAGQAARRPARAASPARTKRPATPVDARAPLPAAEVVKPSPRKAAAVKAEDPGPVSAVEATPVAAPPPVAEPTVVAAPDATLRINSRPWSQVFVDGSLVGTTPQLGLRLPAGTHHIRLVNPELEVSKSFELQALPGATLSRVELLTE